MSLMPELQLWMVEDLLLILAGLTLLFLLLAFVGPARADEVDRRATEAAQRFAAFVARGDFEAAERVAADALDREDTGA